MSRLASIDEDEFFGAFELDAKCHPLQLRESHLISEMLRFAQA